MRILCSCIGMVVLSAFSAHSEDRKSPSPSCDPELFKQYISQKEELDTKLMMLNLYNSEDFNKKQQDSGGSIGVPGIFDASGNNKEQQEEFKRLNTETHFDTSYHNKRDYILSKFDRKGLAAYAECLNSLNPHSTLQAYLIENAPSDNRITFGIHLNYDKAVLGLDTKLRISVYGGSLQKPAEMAQVKVSDRRDDVTEIVVDDFDRIRDITFEALRDPGCHDFQVVPTMLGLGIQPGVLTVPAPMKVTKVTAEEPLPVGGGFHGLYTYEMGSDGRASRSMGDGTGGYPQSGTFDYEACTPPARVGFKYVKGSVKLIPETMMCGGKVQTALPRKDEENQVCYHIVMSMDAPSSGKNVCPYEWSFVGKMTGEKEVIEACSN